MQIVERVNWPPKAPVGGASTAGDNVIYSTRTGDVPFQTPGNVKGTGKIKGWYQANQASTLLLQVFDAAGNAITVNNNGSGDTVTLGTWKEILFDRPSGPHRIVINFATTPTSYKHSDGLDLIPYT